MIRLTCPTSRSSPRLEAPALPCAGSSRTAGGGPGRRERETREQEAVSAHGTESQGETVIVRDSRLGPEQAVDARAAAGAWGTAGPRRSHWLEAPGRSRREEEEEAVAAVVDSRPPRTGSSSSSLAESAGEAEGQGRPAWGRASAPLPRRSVREREQVQVAWALIEAPRTTWRAQRHTCRRQPLADQSTCLQGKAAGKGSDVRDDAVHINRVLAVEIADVQEL
jgi:hypothetical protein